MADPTDAQVLAQVQQGDHRAYMLLFDRYYAAIERYALCLVGDSTAAANAAAATFERGFRDARRKGAATDGYPAHLFALCRRHALRRGLGRGAHRLSLRPRTELPASPAPCLDELPLSIILSRERDDLVRAALNELALPDREVIHLAFEPALRRQDLAVILKRPGDEAVSADLFRALQRLGAVLNRERLVEQAPIGRRTPYAQRWTRT